MTARKYSEESRAETTHFGFEKVRVDEKAGRIAEVFDTVSPTQQFAANVRNHDPAKVAKILLKKSGCRNVAKFRSNP
jgi:hypothetical protein